jgi:broad specificity phosphatase PhoE
MPRLVLVRHAKPAASWGQDPDPGLDPLGVTQAEATAERISTLMSGLPIRSSPLRRCRETAAALETRWRTSADVFDAAGEIPAPPLELASRHEWLMRAMRGTWQELQASAPPGSPDYIAWRGNLLDAFASLQRDQVIYTHFIAINVIVGAARDRSEVVCFRPDHASVTVVHATGGAWQIEELGREAETTVLTGKS